MTGEHKHRITPAEVWANKAAHQTLTAPKPDLAAALQQKPTQTWIPRTSLRGPTTLENFEAKAHQLSTYEQQQHQRATAN